MNCYWSHKNIFIINDIGIVGHTQLSELSASIEVSTIFSTAYLKMFQI